MRPLRAWMGERFPARNAVFFAVFYATALLIGRSVGNGGGPMPLSLRDAAGFVAVWCFFLMLRVFDEHKDFEADAIAHPQRVLQRGLVTLADLRMIGAIAIAVQLGVSLWLDGGFGAVTAWWLAAVAWSVLMAREFFVRTWLRAHLVVYALSHIIVMAILAMWVATMGAPNATAAAAPWAFAVLSLFAGLAFEVARKIRAPEQEHPMADSYTQALGIGPAAAMLLAVVLGAAVAALWLTVMLSGVAGPVALMVLAGAVAAATVAIARFRSRPTPASAKRSEAAVGIAALATHLVVILTLVAAYGVRITP
jgi:4-hydroxybenzoate polyprenyltransferase